MLQTLARNWWVLLIRGICAILFGLIAFAWPGITLFALVMLFGIYCLLDGITAIGVAVATRASEQSWWQMLVVGLLAILAAITAFSWPGLTAISLLFIMAFWAIARGIVEIVAAIELRKAIEHEWLLALAGVASIAFGTLLIARPGLGALTVVWLIGSYAIFYGMLLAGLAFRIRRFSPTVHGGARLA